MNFDLSSNTIAKLVHLRKASGLSQRALAKKVGLSQSAVSKIENKSDDDLTINQLSKYAYGLGAEIHFSFANKE